MLYSEKTVFDEIKWEYGWPNWIIIRLIARYKAKGEYANLCRIIENRGGLKCTL